ncbi:radical SAM protein [candidate division LCP-89 bacterium B3_LCP]|uniref:Radical SAM protein n=1 Tax=candidate division LCP-89 bacterium B3_LCP TaxID=2012998 RepID=A0A532V1B9_UNCL8|nr:MAG: radical SAM protein [candidate division LCP-89 bacterium B3_LCP]
MMDSFSSQYENCLLCGHQCGVNRLVDEQGVCGLSAELLVSSVGPHFGEEPELVGYRGSGTIFFAGCNLDCQFCQNWDISHERRGSPTSIEQLAQHMLDLERIGCHNVNFVTPTPYTPSILEALNLARERDLRVPVVYNCGGYESVEVLALCEGKIEIYMPDAKYSDAEIAEQFSEAPDYPEINQKALKEMHRQVGDLQVVNGVAQRGLLIRHLVLPSYKDNTEKVLKFIATEISPDTYVNVMDQYRPCFRADTLTGMNRGLTTAEYDDAVQFAREVGLHRGF